ncbi:MAG: ABC transporter permease, partial [Muribaculaceae bacterium]|nr:ABC transporter permease [Muribaculaceae bacterium]
MNQKLFKQIRNEWRSNLWMCIELLVVSVLLWYIADYCYVTFSVTSEPRGFDIDHCYLIEFGSLDPSNPDYQEKEFEDKIKDRIEFIERIRNRPEVEAAAYSMNAFPYNGSNSGSDAKADTFSVSGYAIKRMVQPDFIKVFRYTGVNGESPEKLAELLTDNNTLLSENIITREHPDVDARSLVGKDFYECVNPSDKFRVGAIINTVKYADYMQGDMNRSYVFNLPNGWLDAVGELTVRVRENMDKDFVENMMKDAGHKLRVGNLFINQVVPFHEIRESYQLGNKKQIQMYLIGMGFLLMNIFLGLLGTFWFRTQQRVPDIAIRMVNGATRGDVFRLLIGEGLLLLTIVTPLAVLIDANLAHFELNAWYWVDGFMSWSRML